MLNLPSKIVNRAIRRKEASALRPNVSSASVGNVSRHGRAPRGGNTSSKWESSRGFHSSTAVAARHKSKMRSGDWGNLFILANSGLFLASVILQNAGVVDWHSASFVEDGFCVTTCVEIDAAIQDERAVNLIFTQVTAPKTWRSSHAMSFYADAVGAAALAYLAKKYAGEPFAEPVKDAAPGVFMHGLAHLLTWYQGDHPRPAPDDEIAAEGARRSMAAAPMESCQSVVLRSPWGRLGSVVDVRKRLHRTHGGFHRCIHISKVFFLEF